jgi:hypothetical protein
MILEFDIPNKDSIEILRLVGEYASKVKRDDINESIKYAVNKKENSLAIIIIGPGAIGIAGLRITAMNNEGLLKLIIKPFIERGSVLLLAGLLISMTVFFIVKGIQLSSIIFFNSIFIVLFFIVCFINVKTIKNDIITFMIHLNDNK